MKQADTPDTPPPRKKMPADVFVKMWLSRFNDAEEREWKEWIAFDNIQVNRRANLSNVEVEGSIRIEGGIEPLLHLVLSNCHLPNCELRNAKIRSVVIQNNTKIGDFRIKNSATADFQIENSTIGSFEIQEDSNTGSLMIYESIIKQLKIKNSTAKSGILIGSTVVDELVITYATLRRIEIIEGCHVGRFRCRIPLQNPTLLTFSKSFIGELDFDNTVLPEFTTLQLSLCKIKRLSFHNFCNFGAIFLNDLEVSNPSTLRLTDSDLGKMQFINCDLRQFKRFVFSNTKMLDVFVAGSQMPEDKAFCLPNIEQDPLKMAEQKRLAYGQFKKIYEARGDVAGSLPYLAYEMEAYLDELNLKSKSWRDHFGERWMLRLNRYSTNYGNNWLLGAKRIFWTMVICYSLFCLSLGFVPGTDIATFLDVASYAPQYLNPFRDADSVIPDKILPPVSDCWKTWILPWSRLIDYLSRIIVAYFVYQTIQAFRKLGKSSG